MGVVLVGSGGFAEEFLFWTAGTALEKDLVGYIGFKNDRILIPFLGEVQSYSPKDSDEFVVGIGRLDYRMQSINNLKEKQAVFRTFIHPTALIASSASIGEGVIVGPFCLISAGVAIERFVFMNNYSSVGHHSRIHEFAILGPYASITGNCVIGARAQIGVHGGVLPKVKVGEDSRVAPGSMAYRQVPASSIALGVPGKILRDI